MKILFVSDIHLNLSTNPTWEADRYTTLFKILQEHSKEVDEVILGGDIFDNPNPTLQELRLFYKNLQGFQKPVIIIGGNHEVLSKGTDTFDFIPHVNFTFYDYKIIETKKTDIYFCSNKSLSSLLGVKLQIKNKKNMLFTHVRCDVPPHIKEEFSCKYLANTFDLVISGDIHFKYSPFENFHYCGQPYSTKYRPKVAEGYFIVDTDTLSVEFIELNLPSKIKLDSNFGELKQCINTMSNYNLYKVKISGTIEELKDLKVSNGNVVFEKNVITVDSTTEEIMECKIDVVNSLLTTVRSTYQLSDNVMEKGEVLINGISSKYKN